MKRIYVLLAVLFSVGLSYAQNDYLTGEGDGLNGEYWKGATNFDEIEGSDFWNKRPQGTVAVKMFERVEPTIDFEWGDGNPFDDTNEDFAFCCKWKGYLLAPATGTYTFDMTHWDDGFWFSIWDLSDLDSPLAHDEYWNTWGWDKPEWIVDVDLERGKFYKIEVRHYENEFGSHARFAWYCDEFSTMTEVVPQSQLYTQLPDPTSVNNMQSESVQVTSKDNGILIKGLNGEPVSVCNMVGSVVYSAQPVVNAVPVNLPAGLYIVKVGTKSTKVLVK
ncbi:PA14 domain-containing protein [Bacteroides sp.]